MGGDDVDDEVLAALDGLLAAVRANAEIERRIAKRAGVIRAARHRGRNYAEIVDEEHRPLIVEMLREHQNRLTDAGSRFRRAEARALRREGLTLDQIGSVFGVTRQRVIALLREQPDGA